MNDDQTAAQAPPERSERNLAILTTPDALPTKNDPRQRAGGGLMITVASAYQV